STVSPSFQEGGETFFTETGSTARGGVALKESQTNSRVDAVKHGGSTGPEAVKKSMQLIQQRNALGGKSITRADQGTQSLHFIRVWRQRTETMSIGTQYIGEQICVAAIMLAPCNTVTRATSLDYIWMNGHDRVPSGHH